MQHVSKRHYLFARMQDITYLQTVNFVPPVSLHGAWERDKFTCTLSEKYYGLMKQYEYIPTCLSATCCNLQYTQKIMQCCLCSFVFE